ncbi:MAG: alpha/beta hydrolase [Phycisphaeraceae bacterium]|nr:alpha/beta hydrolase [Phycisphaeraceae bacterium]
MIEAEFHPSDRADPAVTIVLLHGILGRGRNWFGIARALAQADAGVQCVALDLPAHGASPAIEPHTVEHAATSIAQWIQAEIAGPVMLAGHSYGGKVAMVAGPKLIDQLAALWIIDATPDPVPDGQGPWLVLDALEHVPGPFSTRKEASDQLRQAGLPLDVAQWLVGNLTMDGDVYRWMNDHAAIRAYLDDYGRVDLWAELESTAQSRPVGLIHAQRSNLLTRQALERLDALSRTTDLKVHALDGGHWIHTEKPDDVVNLLAGSIP